MSFIFPSLTANNQGEVVPAGSSLLASSTRSAGKSGSMVPALSEALLTGLLGRFMEVSELLTDILKGMDHQLPRIITVGQESSGKSSVLESIAMIPVFPRDVDICTRMPIELNLRHASPDRLQQWCQENKTVPERNIRIRLKYDDGRPPRVSEYFNEAEARERVKEWMDEAVREKTGGRVAGIVHHVLCIEITSPEVPNLQLVDLPGIVGGRLVDEPEDMMFQTRQLVEKFMKAPHTLVLAVVPAFERARNSQAFQLVQQYQLTEKCVGVLTMADRALDPSNPNGPLAELQARLDLKSKDVVYLPEGYVAVKNRDSRLKMEVSLPQTRIQEIQWFQENLPNHGNTTCSGVLIDKLVRMMEKHIAEEWIPVTVRKIHDEKLKHQRSLEQLGVPSPKDMLAEISQLMEAISFGEGNHAEEESSGSDNGCAENSASSEVPLVVAELVNGNGLSKNVARRTGDSIAGGEDCRAAVVVEPVQILATETLGHSPPAANRVHLLPEGSTRRQQLYEMSPHLCNIVRVILRSFDFKALDQKLTEIVNGVVELATRYAFPNAFLAEQRQRFAGLTDAIFINNLMDRLHVQLETFAQQVRDSLRELLVKAIEADKTSKLNLSRYVNLGNFLATALQESARRVIASNREELLSSYRQQLMVLSLGRDLEASGLSGEEISRRPLLGADPRVPAFLKVSFKVYIVAPLIDSCSDPLVLATALQRCLLSAKATAGTADTLASDSSYVLYENCWQERRRLETAILNMSRGLDILAEFVDVNSLLRRQSSPRQVVAPSQPQTGLQPPPASQDVPRNSFSSSQSLPSPPPSKPTTAHNGAALKDTLQQDCVLLANEQLTDATGGYVAQLFQEDCTLRVFKADSPSSTWSTPAPSHAKDNVSCRLIVQGDGNLVIYGKSASGEERVCWASCTMHKGAAPYRLKVWKDGRLYLFDGGDKVIWRSQPPQAGVPSN